MNDGATKFDGSQKSHLVSLLAECVRLDASDLHLSQGACPMVRVQGRLESLADQPPLGESEMQRIADELLGSGQADWSKGSIDGACFGPDDVRFRFNLYRRQGLLAAAMRRLEDRFRPLAELGLPEAMYSLSDLRDGLVIISGPSIWIK